MNYYDVRLTRKECKLARLFYILGQRGVGKSYSVKKALLENFFKLKEKFVYVRRWVTEINKGEMDEVFSDVMNGEDTEVNEWLASYDPEAKWYQFHVLYKSKRFYLVGEKESGQIEFLEEIGHITCVSQAEKFKGGTYNDFTSIFFDEFITELGYVRGDKEPELFAKIVNTVGRAHNKKLTIYMCGNPDSSIEMCPYLYPLMLDYARMSDNTSYTFDSKTADGKILAENICVIKLARFEGKYLNENTSSLFGTSEEAMSVTGDVKTNKYIHTGIQKFVPEYELIVETPVITDTEYHRKIYAYYGMMYGEPMLYITTHRMYKDLSTLYCRYDKNDCRPREYTQTFRLNIPPLEQFNSLKKYIACVDANKFILTDDDAAATLFEQIRLQTA